MRTKSQAEDFVRRIEINPTKMFFRERASKMLHTVRGSHLRKKRAVDVETMFGDIKRNHRFDRFTLRGLDKASLKLRLVAMGHNIRKVMGMLGGMKGRRRRAPPFHPKRHARKSGKTGIDGCRLRSFLRGF